ncbi:ABC transporter permease [Natronosporangium hydrolyticum]|uniref:ABC transporter permease n=1 Tax=Natronosporangium hydrolyticum TaxID=2811111 RepID=A0A895YP18_9ACTN|nr:ABC transporter permease [Natronosporangium hydrolyticum]QSB17033.1 ABC transporter permease [Natronosporangium hydrolyticum]
MTAAGRAAAGPATAPPPRRVSVGAFARLKLRMLGNGLQGSTGRVLSFLGGMILAVLWAFAGFMIFVASSAGDAQIRLLVAAFAGAILTLGSMLLPLIWFGIDDTLDPARFALLPLRRRQLVAGLFTAALVSVPAAATLVATLGLVVPAAAHGGVVGALGQLLGVLCGLLVCVAASRAVTSAFATMLRSRRVRDLAGILLAGVAALLAPMQFLAMSAAREADWDRVAAVAQVIGWTPLAAPYTVGVELSEGAAGAALAKLLIGVATLAALLWWWSRSLESALVGAAHSSGPARADRAAVGGAVGQLLPRWLPGLPAQPAGALIAKEVRYWWRDAKRRANLITIAVIGVLVPVMVTAGSRVIVDAEGEPLAVATSPMADLFSMLLVAAFAASVLANQFGFDGTAYAAQLTTGVSGRLELRARALGHALLMVPLLLLVGVFLAVLRGEATTALAAWGVLLAGYGTGLAINTLLSVLAPYALPEGSNPFATATGAGLSKSMLALVAIVAAGVVTAPILLAAALLGDAWPWLAVPLGAGYGLGLAALGCYLAGDIIDRRGPWLLRSVSPRQ